MLKKQIQLLESKKMMKKIKKSGSYLSMENLGFDDHNSSSEEEEEVKVNNNGIHQSDLEALEEENVELHPIFILQQAFSKVNAVGSSTALVAARNKKTISIANLGDSGFVIIRFKNEEAFTFARSKDQQHSFNIPYQLSILPTEKDIENLKTKGRIEEIKNLRRVLKNKNNLCQDCPEMADEYEYELQDGDIIVSATDGVLDNLFTHEILKTVKEFKQKHQRLTSKDQAIVSLSLKFCRN